MVTKSDNMVTKSDYEKYNYLYHEIISKAYDNNNKEILLYITITLNTSLRSSDILNLKQNQIDIKNKKLRHVLLIKQSSQYGKDIFEDTYVYNINDVCEALKHIDFDENSNDMLFKNTKRTDILKFLNSFGSKDINLPMLKRIGFNKICYETLKSK